MTIRAECHGCGEDCTHACVTYKGDTYHIGCIPVKPRQRSVSFGIAPPPIDAALRQGDKT